MVCFRVGCVALLSVIFDLLGFALDLWVFELGCGFVVVFGLGLDGVYGYFCVCDLGFGRLFVSFCFDTLLLWLLFLDCGLGFGCGVWCLLAALLVALFADGVGLF